MISSLAHSVLAAGRVDFDEMIGEQPAQQRGYASIAFFSIALVPGKANKPGFEELLRRGAALCFEFCEAQDDKIIP